MSEIHQNEIRGWEIYGCIPCVLILEAEEVHKGIRVRYSIDQERASMAAADLEELITEIWRRRSK
ncbi:MAG TPA: hypothetical protein VGA03_05200, partial [Anaerolineales bacterium]